MKINNINKTGFSGTFRYKDGADINAISGKLKYAERFFTEECLDKLELSIKNNTPDDKEYEISLMVDRKIQYLASYQNKEVYLNRKYLTVEVDDITDSERKSFKKKRLWI